MSPENPINNVPTNEMDEILMQMADAQNAEKLQTNEVGPEAVIEAAEEVAEKVEKVVKENEIKIEDLGGPEAVQATLDAMSESKKAEMISVLEKRKNELLASRGLKGLSEDNMIDTFADVAWGFNPISATRSVFEGDLKMAAAQTALSPFAILFAPVFLPLKGIKDLTSTIRAKLLQKKIDKMKA